MIEPQEYWLSIEHGKIFKTHEEYCTFAHQFKGTVWCTPVVNRQKVEQIERAGAKARSTVSALRKLIKNLRRWKLCQNQRDIIDRILDKIEAINPEQLERE